MLLPQFVLFFSNDNVIKFSQPRNKVIEIYPSFYQPIVAKVFGVICGNFYSIEGCNVKVIPLLPAKDYPLSASNLDKYGEAYNSVRKQIHEIENSVNCQADAVCRKSL